MIIFHFANFKCAFEPFVVLALWLVVACGASYTYRYINTVYIFSPGQSCGNSWKDLHVYFKLYGGICILITQKTLGVFYKSTEVDLSTITHLHVEEIPILKKKKEGNLDSQKLFNYLCFAYLVNIDFFSFTRKHPTR